MKRLKGGELILKYGWGAAARKSQWTSTCKWGSTCRTATKSKTLGWAEARNVLSSHREGNWERGPPAGPQEAEHSGLLPPEAAVAAAQALVPSSVLTWGCGSRGEAGGKVIQPHPHIS